MSLLENISNVPYSKALESVQFQMCHFLKCLEKLFILPEGPTSCSIQVQTEMQFKNFDSALKFDMA